MSLSYYYSLLQEKKKQLARLQACDSQLKGTQQEFSHYMKIITQPELTPLNWQGSLANRFDEIRYTGMLYYYKDIEGNQFSNVFASLQAKIQQIINEIISIQQTIAYLEAEAARQRAKQ